MGLAFPHGDLEALEIDLTHGPLADLAVGVITIRLLIVGGEVFDRRAAAGMLLHALCDGGGKLAGDQRIFGEIFKVASAADIAVNVQRRSQPQLHAEAFHLIAHQIAAGFGHIQVPALRQRGSDGNGCAILLADLALSLAVSAQLLHQPGHSAGHQLQHALRHGLADRMSALLIHGIVAAQPQPGGAVRHDQRRDPLLLQAVYRLARGAGHRLGSVADHAQAARPGIEGANVQQRQFFLRQSGDCRIYLVMAGIADRFRPDRRCADRDHLYEMQGLFLALFGSEVGKIRLAQAVFPLPGHRVRVQTQDGRGLCLRAGIAQAQHIVALLQDPRRLLLVIGGKITQAEGQRHVFALSGRKLPRLGEGRQRLIRFVQSSLRRGDIELRHLFAGQAAGIPDLRAHRDGLPVKRGLGAG